MNIERFTFVPYEENHIHIVSFSFPVYSPYKIPNCTGITPAYKHFYHAVIDNDTVLVIELRTFHVFPPEKFKDKKQEKFYWKTVRDVKKTLPYAKLIYSILIETYEYMETLPDDKAREEHMKKMEKEVFQQYKPVLKKFTLSQGKMLIKLINRGM